MIATASLLFFRLLPIFVVAPVASFRRAPVLARVMLCVLLSLILAGNLPAASAGLAQQVSLVFFVQEFFAGMLLAFGLHAAVAVMQAFGQLIDFQVGFAAGAVFDPSSEQMASLTGELLTVALLVVFLVLNVHHDLLIGLNEFNKILPPGQTFGWNADGIFVFGGIFTLGFIIASPVIITLWLFDLGVAFVSRSLPQAQMYFVALPMKVGVGILALAWLSANLIHPFHRLLSRALSSWNAMFSV